MSLYIFIAASLLLISVLLSQVADRFGVPKLLFFLALAMLAGPEGPGGISFVDPILAQSVSIVAFAIILFSGGFDTNWSLIRPVAGEGLLLSTLGVLMTALFVGIFSSTLFEFTLLEGLLLGSIVSSTDAAAVFSVLRSRGIRLKDPLQPLLELESGSNDPAAIALTMGVIRMMSHPHLSLLNLVGLFAQQMFLGAVVGLVAARIMLLLIKRLDLGYHGLYPLLILALALITFGLTGAIGGSGFLAVYVAGIILGRSDFPRKKSLLRFHNSLAWLMQITLFVTMGLLVVPSRLVPGITIGLVIAASQMFIARPLGVLVASLLGSRGWRERAFVSWVGLRGGTSLILATFPVLAGVRQAELIFNIVFVIVLTSALVQGVSILPVARWLKVDAPGGTACQDPG